ncbi:MAG: antitoxin [Kiritimatiellia bacterium]
MRTTLSIDDDLLAAARSLARAKSQSLGQALSELARRGLAGTPRVRAARPGAGFPMFSVPRDAHPITIDDVRQAEDEA